MKNKIFLYIIVVISLLIRINFEISYADMYIDKVDQIGAAKSMVNGYGLSYCQATTKDISQTQSFFLNIWPPGYTLLLIPFYYITSDFVNASIIVDILCIVLLYISILLLFSCLNISLKNQIYIFVFFGLSFTPFYHLSSSDLISLTIFQWAVYFTIYYLKNNIKLIQLSLLTGVLLFLTGFIRYSYYPLMFAIPLAVLLIGLFTKQKKIIYFSIISGCIAFILLIFQTLIIKFYSGNLYRSLEEIGLFWNNLQKFDVFPFKSFFFYEGFLKTIYKSFSYIEPLHIVIASSFSLLLLFEIFRVLLYKKQINKLVKYYLIIGLTVLMVNVLFLSYMSITHKGQIWKVPPWTYVEATRYYSQSMVFLEIIVFTFIIFDQYKNKTLKFLYKIVIFSIMLYASIYWLNNNYNIYIKKDTKYTFKGMYSEELEIGKILKSQSNFNKFTVFTSPDPVMSSFIYIFTDVDAILYDCYGIIYNGVINSSKPVTLFIALPHNKDYLQTLYKYYPEKIAELKSYNLYKINLN